MSDPIQGGRQFAFLLVDKFSMFSLAAAIDAFRSANRLLGRDYLRLDHRLGRRRGGDGLERPAAQGRLRRRRHSAGRHPVRLRRADHRIPRQEQGARRAAQLGPARRRARRAVGRLLPARRGRPARRPSLHHPLGKPRRLHGAFPRHQLHRQRLRDRPQALHLRRRHHLDRPDAGDRPRRFRLQPRQRRRQPVPARAHPLGRRPPARRAGARPHRQVGEAEEDRRADGRQSRRAVLGRAARQVGRACPCARSSGCSCAISR